MSDPRAFREERQALRARRVAHRIIASGGVERFNRQLAAAPRLDAVCAPGVVTGHVVAEPSKQTLEHMAGFGYAVSEAAEGGAVTQPAPVASSSVSDLVAAGVAKALAALGIKSPVASGDTPPRNEDK